MTRKHEKLLDLAYAFKKAEVWNTIGGSDIFAVKHEDGSVSYCSVLGMDGVEYALNVYTGPDGYASFLRLTDLADDPDFDNDDPFLTGELITAPKCVSCSFENRDMVTDKEAEDIHVYAKKRKMSLRGRNMYAAFLDYTPGLMAWGEISDRDRDILCDAFEASLSLCDMIEEDDVSIDELCLRGSTVMLCRENGKWTPKQTGFPPERFSYPSPRFTDELKLHRITCLKKAGVWQCGAFYPNVTIGDIRKGEHPYYPLFLLKIPEGSEYLEIIHYGDGRDPEIFMTAFADHIVDSGKCPLVIHFADPRCFSLLEDLCKKAGIDTDLDGDTSAILDAELDLCSDISGGGYDDYEDSGLPFDDDFEAFIQDLLISSSGMSREELLSLPDDAILALKEMARARDDYSAFSKKLDRLFPHLEP